MTMTTTTRKWLQAVTMATMTAGGGLALAAPPDGPPPPHHRPPEEAFTACAQANDGDSCTVTLPDHTLNGTCHAVPPHLKEDAGRLVCMPPRPPRQKGDQ